jgi:hypothetical protein
MRLAPLPIAKRAGSGCVPEPRHQRVAVGLDDRDYMRERRRRVGRFGGAPWFDGTNRGFDYQKGRKVRFGPHPMQKWIILLSAASFLYPMYREARRSGWLPDREAALPFPPSGSVTVNAAIDPHDATSRMRVVTASANAVVQLFDPGSDHHVISVYVHGDDDVTVPVSPGTYRMRVIEGDKWHGPVKFFGPSTTYESIVKLMTFTRRHFGGIDLHRRPDGTLKTRVKIGDPPPLLAVEGTGR